MLICKDEKSSWWSTYNDDDIDLFVLIAGDSNATSFGYFDDTCKGAKCHGILANQITDHGSGAGNSAWGYPDGTVNFLGGGEKVLYSTLPLPTAELTGQIMVDPDTPRWMVRNQDSDGDGKLDPFFMCGPGDPEDFLYRGTRNADGTRNGDQMTLINKMKDTGANCIYMQIVRSHGGDGLADHNPWVDSNPANGLDQDILDQWETWFTEMDQAGIVIYLFFYDDNIKVSSSLGWPLSSGELHPGEKSFVEGIVNRFEHHKNLIWCVMEEIQEMGGDHIAHAKAIARTVKAADDHDHVVACHQLNGLSFLFPDEPSIDQYAIQYTNSSVDGFHSGMVTAWNNAAGRYGLNMSEGHPTAASGSAARLRSWACALGGAYVMHLGMNISGTPVSALEDCGRLVSFMESTDFNRMAPHDELKSAGTQYVLALPGESYIAYASALSGEMGLKGLTAGTYYLKWFDPVDGDVVEQTGVSVAAGDQSWPKPASIGSEAALYVKRTGGGGNVPPNANASASPTTGLVPLEVSFSAAGSSDPDGTIVAYAWAFGDGSSGTGASPNHTYTAAGTYTAVLTVTDDDGATDTDSVVITVTEPAPNQPPVAEDSSVTTEEGQQVWVQLSYSDPDNGPGPYVETITQGPANGVLTGSGNDRYYTPNAGFTGTDSFQWKVNDGEDDSNIATATITVTPGPEPLTASASAAPTTGDAPLAVSFSGSASGGAGGGGQFLESGGQVVMEAENFTGAGKRTDPNGYEWSAGSEGGVDYVTTPLPQGTNGLWTNACEVSYAVKISTAGTYIIWRRVFSPDGASNSGYIGVNGSQLAADNAGGYQAWKWIKDGSVSLVAGDHTVQLRRREAGYRVDRIVLTTDAGFSPSGVGPAESARSGSYSYSWAFGDGGSSSEQNPSHTYTSAGTYTATLTVSDGTDTATDSVTVTVTQAHVNELPVAVADSADGVYVVDAGTLVTLTGSSSYDPDNYPAGGIQSWSWAQT
ncbi:MAG: PKD domain-containing protein, partial [Planctomycetota bacterium]